MISLLRKFAQKGHDVELVEAVELWVSLLKDDNPQKKILQAIISELQMKKRMQNAGAKFVRMHHGKPITTDIFDEVILVGMSRDDWEDEREKIQAQKAAVRK